MTARFDRSLIPLHPDCSIESNLWQHGVSLVAGLDEAGRGAWAGPVFAGAVVLPPEPAVEGLLNGVRDSKQMTALKREYWAGEIQTVALAWGVGWAEAAEIDRIGILPATRLAMARAVEQLGEMPETLLVDGNFLLPEIPLPQQALIKGDGRSLSIAAASILAKTARDSLLIDYEDTYPGYGFARHKGYGTALHRAALEQLGACPIHRHSYAPIRRIETN
jgi:ribonuclease HII